MELELMRWIPSLIGLFIAGFNAAIFMIIKFNDLRHLENSVKELVATLKETNKTLMNNGERLATLEGRCKANHG
jgi:hypothetical protein